MASVLGVVALGAPSVSAPKFLAGSAMVLLILLALAV